MRAVFCFLSLALCAPAQVVISQIYGGGGNVGATLRNDFVELFNRGSENVSVTGWRMEYASATGDFTQSTLLTGTVGAGRYYLIQQARGAGGTQDLPVPDATGEIPMSATSARVRIVRGDGSIVDEAAYTATNTTAAARRDAGCQEGFSPALPAPRNSQSPAKDCGAILPVRQLTISQIQGPGMESPYAGERVETTGWVALKSNNGFYLQSFAPDGDDRTSEGLFVFTRTAPPAELPASVRVVGTVTEFRPAADPASLSVTEITDPIMSPGPDLQIPVRGPLTISDKFFAAARDEDLEPFEGMLVSVPGLRIVEPSDGAIDDARAEASSGGVAFAAPNLQPIPQSEPAPRDGNPERVRLLDFPARSAGDNVTILSGALDYGQRTWTIAGGTGLVLPRNLQPQPVIAAANGELAVATFNLRRFFDNIDDPGVGEPVLTADAFRRRVFKTAKHIRELLRAPAIVAVQEAESLRGLEALAAELGPTWRAFLEEGNDPSGIDVGFLVDIRRVMVERVQQLEKDAGFHDRPPYLLRARVGDIALHVLNVHQRSLINAGDPTVRAKRQAQADAVAAIARGLRDENLIVTGDFNANPFDDGFGDMLAPLRAVGLARLGDLLPAEDAYTYIEDGNQEQLDHIFVSQPLMRRLTRYQVAHTNAPFPVTDFNLTFDAQRASDHDVPVGYFHVSGAVPGARPIGLVNAASYLGGAISGGEIVTLFATGIERASRVLFDGQEARILYIGANQINMTVPALAGKTSVRVQIFAGQGGIAEFEMPVRPKAGLFGLNGTVTRGSIVELYGTGTATAATIGGYAAEVLYAGPAPSLPPGVLQMNVRVPERLPAGRAEVLLSGEATSQRGVFVDVR